jgi:type I restriction enzyme M protein
MSKPQAAEEKVSAEKVSAIISLQDGMLPDFITGNPVKETPKELVRQELARALLFEYRISPQDMQPDFPVKVGSKRKRIEIGIFDAGKEHTVEHLRRAVICRPQPNVGSRSVIKLRDHDQAKEDLEELKDIMTAVEGCTWGLWTNGIERFFLKKVPRRFEVRFEPSGDWPMGDESLGTPDVLSETYLRRASEESLRRAFQRCHNFIHGNEGMPKDAAFWQFLYLIFAKMYDERRNNGKRQFWAFPDEPFEAAGRKKIRERILPLFEAVKKEYKHIFRGKEEITLSDRALAYMVSELARYDLTRTEVDVKGAAYQEIVGANLRGDRGQYFTPRRAVNLMVTILDPKPQERVLDPACGTGGFLVATIAHQFKRFRADLKKNGNDKTAEAARERVQKYASEKVYGADFDPFLVRASTMNLLMAANTEGNIFHMDSLAFPRSHLDGNEVARKKIPFGSIDVLMTNPPFGSEIPITDPAILASHDLARRWKRNGDQGAPSESGLQHAVAPEVLFIERSVKWLREGGRMGIVLPNGILGNPGDEHIRRWILRHCWVLACVEVPVEAFIVEANVGILTSLLFLKKKTEEEINAETLGRKIDYPVFMAVAETAGVDRRGNTLYKHTPEGDEIVEEVEFEESVWLGGKEIKRMRKERRLVIDDDFPTIASEYRKFRLENAEPGA